MFSESIFPIETSDFFDALNDSELIPAVLQAFFQSVVCTGGSNCLRIWIILVCIGPFPFVFGGLCCCFGAFARLLSSDSVMVVVSSMADVVCFPSSEIIDGRFICFILNASGFMGSWSFDLVGSNVMMFDLFLWTRNSKSMAHLRADAPRARVLFACPVWCTMRQAQLK